MVFLVHQRVKGLRLFRRVCFSYSNLRIQIELIVDVIGGLRAPCCLDVHVGVPKQVVLIFHGLIVTLEMYYIIRVFFVTHDRRI